jgi:RNA polymerase sigma-54 factor
MLEIDTRPDGEQPGGDARGDGISGAGPDDQRRDERASGEEKRREDFDWQEYLQEREYDDVSYASMRGYSSSEPSDDIAVYAQSKSSGDTLIDHLMTQLSFSGLKGRSHDIGEYIIESLDDNGYLTQSAQEIAGQFGVQPHCVEKIIGVIRTFDPVGVCASDLGECLLMQLEEMGLADDLMRGVVGRHLDDIAANRLSVIAREYGISKEEAQVVADVIKKLEPKPGRAFSNGTDPNYIIPDVIVEKTADGYSVTVSNDEMPRLMVSPYYRKVMKQEGKDSGAAQFLSQRLNSAMWLIKSVNQRRETIRKVSEAVVRRQEDFLDRGRKHLKPLTLRTIAEEVGIHESTVSRAVNGKYMQTPRGVFEIKYFFSSGTGRNSAESVASGGVKVHIEDIIRGEDPRSPISDQQIADRLGASGIDISRRTVAKYRDEMGIPSSSARRRY